MKISRACSKCIAFPICDVGYPNRGNDACRNFHDAMESKITSHNKRVMPCKHTNAMLTEGGARECVECGDECQ
jgi:hypothetical protein